MTVAIQDLDIGTLCYLVGQGFNQQVLDRLRAEGFTDVKVSFGYVVQHVLDGSKTVTELATRMGVSQQAASKRVREMLDAGILQRAPGQDRRESRVALSPRGLAIVARTRALRQQLANELAAHMTTEDLQVTRQCLAAAIARLQMTEAVEQRHVQEHD
jgi:DNA-binding MarR family transcriptional regulator